MMMPFRSFSNGGFHATCTVVELTAFTRTSCGSPGTVLVVTQQEENRKHIRHQFKALSLTILIKLFSCYSIEQLFWKPSAFIQFQIVR